MKNTPNHRRDPLKNSKNILFQKSKCTHVSSINLKGKVTVTAAVYFCSYPYGTPCTNTFKKIANIGKENADLEAELEGELNEFEMVSSKADEDSNDPEWENQIQQMLDAEENN